MDLDLEFTPLASPPRVYILRVWREEASSERGWRASLRRGESEEKRHFSSATALLEYLEREMSR